MKKFLFTICAVTLLSMSAYAACDGGTMYGSYCRSNQTMNWWSAYNWCKTNGMQLVSLYDVCPDFDGVHTGDICQTVSGAPSGWNWTTTASGIATAFYVALSSGAFRNNAGRNYGDGITALCR